MSKRRYPGRKRLPNGWEMRPSARRQLGPAEVLAIQCSTEPLKIVAHRYGISVAHVSRIRLGIRWQWFSKFSALQLNAELVTLAFVPGAS